MHLSFSSPTFHAWSFEAARLEGISPVVAVFSSEQSITEPRSSSLSAVVVEKLRGRCVLLLQVGQDQLQLLDQDPLLKPAADVQ